MIAAGDADMAPPSHYVEVFKLLDGGLRDGGWMGEGRPKGGHALAIIPNATHYNVFLSPLLAQATLAFLDAGHSLDGPAPGATQASSTVRSSRASRSGSARMSIATIRPDPTVMPITA